MTTIHLYTTLLICAFSLCRLTGQSAADSISPTFPKIIFVNEQNEILLYFDDRRKAYEVPSNGFIEGPIDFTKYIDTLAKDIGISYTRIRLGGLFTYIYPNSYSTFIRPYFVVQTTNTDNTTLKEPKCAWFTIQDGLKEIKYPASRMITQKILTEPNNVWMATFEEYGYTNPVDERTIKIKVLANFKPLSSF